jgi:hypothetical protein
VDDWEGFSGIDDAIDLEVGAVEVLALLDGLLVVVALQQSFGVGLVEPVDFVFHVPAEGIDFWVGEPLSVEVAPPPVFDEVFLLLRILPFSPP